MVNPTLAVLKNLRYATREPPQSRSPLPPLAKPPSPPLLLPRSAAASSSPHPAPPPPPPPPPTLRRRRLLLLPHPTREASVSPAPPPPPLRRRVLLPPPCAAAASSSPHPAPPPRPPPPHPTLRRRPAPPPPPLRRRLLLPPPCAAAASSSSPPHPAPPPRSSSSPAPPPPPPPPHPAPPPPPPPLPTRAPSVFPLLRRQIRSALASLASSPRAAASSRRSSAPPSPSPPHPALLPLLRFARCGGGSAVAASGWSGGSGIRLARRFCTYEERDDRALEEEAKKKFGWILKMFFLRTAGVVGYQFFLNMGDNLLQRSISLLHVKGPLFKRMGASHLACFAVDDKEIQMVTPTCVSFVEKLHCYLRNGFMRSRVTHGNWSTMLWLDCCRIMT